MATYILAGCFLGNFPDESTKKIKKKIWIQGIGSMSRKNGFLAIRRR